MYELLCLQKLSIVHRHVFSVFIISALLGDKQRFGSGGLITLNYAHLFDVQNPKSCSYLRSSVKILNAFTSVIHFLQISAPRHIFLHLQLQSPFKAYACRENASRGNRQKITDASRGKKGLARVHLTRKPLEARSEVSERVSHVLRARLNQQGGNRSSWRRRNQKSQKR